jgi:hypothetical protein
MQRLIGFISQHHSLANGEKWLKGHVWQGHKEGIPTLQYLRTSGHRDTLGAAYTVFLTFMTT